MDYKVHKVRYYSPKPRSINCASYCKDAKVLAVAREDATIEIWEISNAPHLVTYIPGVENGSVEALGWVDQRLISTGLGGALVEWDLDKLIPKKTLLLTGYAAWCLDVSKTAKYVAVGTEQGFVNLYTTQNSDLLYEKLFDKQEGRIICCKFDKSGSILVTGSTDNIRIWNVATGHAVNKISTKRRGKETIIWSIAVLADSTIVSGDSSGRLTFWDVNSGDQIESYTTHKADILSLTVNEEENSIFCSGVDPVIVNFVKVKSDKNASAPFHWSKNLQRNIHEHDVRCVLLKDEKLISVGVDGYLTFSSYPPKWVMRVPPMLPTPRSRVCVKKKLLLLRHINHLEIWKLGTYAKDDKGNIILTNSKEKKDTTIKNKSLEADSINQSSINPVENKERQLKLAEDPVKLASIKSKGSKQIKCCDLSPNGEMIAYSTESSIRILKLDMDTEDTTSTSLSKLTITGLTVSTCIAMQFTPCSKYLAVCSNGNVYVLRVDPTAGATISSVIDTKTHLSNCQISHFVISEASNGRAQYMVVANASGSICVWYRPKSAFNYLLSLPKYDMAPTALTVDSKSDVLVAVYGDQKVIEYDLNSKKLINKLSGRLPPAWYEKRTAIMQVCTHPKRDNVLIFQDQSALYVLENPIMNGESTPKKKYNQEHGNASLRIIPIKYTSGFHWLGDDEAVIIEVQPESIVAQLPDVLHRKKVPVD